MDQIFKTSITEEHAQLAKARALTRLLEELELGENCEQTYSEEEVARLLGIKG